MLRVVHGEPMDGRSEALLDEALAEGAAGYLHVVRTRARERQLREREAARSGRRLGAAVVRLSDLVRAVASRRTHLRAAIGDGQRALLLDDLARHEARAPLRGVAGLADWLGRLFSRLKQGDVFSVDRAFERFRSLDRGDPGTAEALRLFGLYQTRLVELGLYDDDGIYLEVARDLGTPEIPFDRIQPARRRLVAEGFYQTNVVERAIFARLFEAFDETLWLVDAPEGERGGVYEDDLKWLGGFSRGGAERSPRLGQGKPCAPALHQRKTSREVQLAVAPDERAEAVFLAERAAALVRAEPAASVVIAYPSDRLAAPLLQEACADVGLPLEVGPFRTLAECASARSFLSLLDLATRDFPRDRVIAALRGAEGGVALGGVRLTAPRVDRVSRKAGITGGAASWLPKLERLARSRAAAAEVAGEDDREGLLRAAAEAEDVRRGIAALIDLIPRPGGALSVAAFAEKARELMDRFGFQRGEQVPAGTLRPEEVEAFAAAAGARAALGTVVDGYEASSALVRADERPWSEHVAALRALVGATTVPFPPLITRGATLVGVRELRGLVTDHLLVGGLTDDAFPGPAEHVPLLDEADAALAGAHTAEARRREAEHLLLQALRSPRRSLVLSRPAQKGGCEALPALALEAVPASAKTIDAGRELREGLARGRATRARRLAAALVDAGTPAAAAESRLRELEEAGADAALAWHRLGAERERRDPARVGRFEGMLEPAALPLLAAGLEEVRTSASKLETYAKCPLLDFYKRVLRLDPVAETDREVSALDKGSVVHEILYEFHTAVEARRIPRADQARELERLARAALAELPYDGLFAETFRDFLTRDLLTVGPPRRPGLLRAYLDHEHQRGDAFRPAFFEARFGPARHGADPASILSPDAIPIGETEAGGKRLPIVMTGSIDRVDLLETASGEILALVLDYKTGGLENRRKETAAGRWFQLPMYAHVLPRLLESRLGGKKARPIAAAYYQIRGPSEVGIEEPLVDDANRPMITKRRLKGLPDGGFDRLVAEYARRSRDVVEAQLAGWFHPTAIGGFGDSPCDLCDFAAHCRGRGESARLEKMPADGRFAQVVELVPRERGKGKP